MKFSSPVVAGEGALVREAIKSPNYVPGVSGWSVDRNGTAEFQEVIIGGQPAPDYVVDPGTELLRRDAIRSVDYDPGVAGWRIGRDGSVEFGAGVFRGRVEASAGSFAGDLTAGTVNGRPVPGGHLLSLEITAPLTVGHNNVHRIHRVDNVQLQLGRRYRVEASFYGLVLDPDVVADFRLRAAPTTDPLTATGNLNRVGGVRMRSADGSYAFADLVPGASGPWSLALSVQKQGSGAGSLTVEAAPDVPIRLSLYDSGSP